MHCAIETGGVEGRLHVIVGEGHMSETLSPAEIHLPEAEAELAPPDERRARRGLGGGLPGGAGRRSPRRSRRGDWARPQAASLEPIVELALKTGRIRAIYGPGRTGGVAPRPALRGAAVATQRPRG